MDKALLETDSLSMRNENFIWPENMTSVGESITETIANHLITTALRTNSTSTESYFPQMGPKRDPLYLVVPLTCIYAIIFLTGIVGNVSTCIVIARNKTMHTATNYYLFSLAISDLLLLVTGLPQEIYFLWSRYPYVFGEIFCVGRGLAAETSANATVLTITAFTIERYVAICRPFLSHTMSKLSRAVKLILLIWLVSLLVAIPQALQFGLLYVVPNNPEMLICGMKHVIIKHSFELHTVLLFVLPMTVITALYLLIGFRLRHSNMMKKVSSASTTSGGSISNTTSIGMMTRSNLSCRHQGQSSRRVLKMLVAVVVAFFLCWAPFHVQRLIAIYGGPQNPQESKSKSPMLRLYEVVTYISGVLYYLSTTINPMLYHLMSNKFRSAFKDTFSRWCCSCCVARDTRHLMERSYSALSQRGIGQGPHQINRQHFTRGTRRGSDRGFGQRERPESEREYGSSTGPEQSITDCSGNSSSALQQSSMLSTNPDGSDYGRTSTTSLNGSSLILTNSHILPTRRKLTKQASFHKNVTEHHFATHYRTRSKIWKFFHWLTHSRTGGSPPTSYYSPPMESVSPELDNKNTRFGLSPCSISNSSLRDVENGALEDELTVYMQQLQKRERQSLYTMQR